MGKNTINGILDLTVVTPTVQMTGNNADNTVINTRKAFFVFNNEDKKISVAKVIPFISGESLRGIARRRLALQVMKRIIENSGNDRFTPDIIHAFVDGGMTDLNNKPTYNEELQYREAMPFFSVFGVGLSLSGKLIIQDAFPVLVTSESDDDIVYENEYEYAHLAQLNDNVERKINRMLGRFPFSKRDDITNHQSYVFDFLTLEDIKAWEESVKEKSTKREQQRKGEGEGSLKGTTQLWQEIEYITPGTKLRTEIGAFEDESLSDAEKGCIILAAMELVKTKRIGAYQRKNWGLYDAELNLQVDDKIAGFIREIDKTNLLKDGRINMQEEKELRDYIDAFWDTISKLTVKDIHNFIAAMKNEKKK